MKKEPIRFEINGQSLPISQARVLSLMIHGLCARDRAEILKISIHTENSHTCALYQKFGIHKCTPLAIFSLKHGFDEQGRCQGVYMFDGFTNLPWPEPDGSEPPATEV